jgi:putative multiple sugar transport system substrate-binding protein
MKGETFSGLDTTSYPNGASVNGSPYIVPSLLLDSVIVTNDNVQRDVIDTGYHTAAELGL